jgi:hypothetical protein
LRPTRVELDITGARAADEDVRWLMPNAVGIPRGATAQGGARVEWRRLRGGAQVFRLEVPVFEARTQNSMVSGSASARGWPNPRIQVDARHFDLDGQDVANQLKTMRLPVTLNGVRLTGRAVLDGVWGKPQTLDAQLKDATLDVWGQELAVEGHLRGLSQPRVEGAVRAAQLDVTELQQHWKGTRAAGGGAFPADATVSVDVDVQKVHTEHLDLGGVTGRVTLANGVVTLAPLRVEVLDGAVFLDATTVRVAPDGVVEVRVRANIQDLDAGALVNQHKRVLDGRMTAVMDVQARGRTLEAMLDDAQGPVAFRFKTLTFYDLDLLGSVQLPGGAKNPLALRDRELPPTILYDGNGAGMLKRQHVVFTRTLATPTNFGFLELDGTVDIHGYANLKGTAEVSPDAVSEMTSGAYRPKSAARTPIQLVGPPGELSILDVNARMFMKDDELPTLLESAGRMAQSTREQWRRRADEEAARIRARMEEERAIIQNDMRRRAAELRALLGETRPDQQDGGVPSP